MNASLDAHYDLRSRATIALGRIGPAEVVVPFLTGRLEESLNRCDYCCQEIAEALAQFGDRAAVAIPQLARAVVSPHTLLPFAASRALGAIGPVALPALVELLRHWNVKIRELAARALGMMGPGAEPAVHALAAALRDAECRVREAAAEALGRVGPAAAPAVPALREMLWARRHTVYWTSAAMGALRAIQAEPCFRAFWAELARGGSTSTSL